MTAENSRNASVSTARPFWQWAKVCPYCRLNVTRRGWIGHHSLFHAALTYPKWTEAQDGK